MSDNPWVATEVDEEAGVVLGPLEECSGLDDKKHIPTKTEKGFCPVCGLVGVVITQLEK